MKKLSTLLMTLSLAVACGPLVAQAEHTATTNSAKESIGQSIIRSGTQASFQGSDATFTGTVRVTPLYPVNNAMRSSGGSVTFTAGARSHWHIHPVGQVLIVTSGVGRTQEWGKPVQEIRTGDVIICPAGVKHWHGAAPDSSMTHISVCEEKEAGKVVEWMEKVSDAQYNGK